MKPRTLQNTVASGSYIAGFWYDHVFFIGAPLLAVLVGFAAVQLGAYGLRLSGRSDTGAILQVALPTYIGAPHLAAFRRFDELGVSTPSALAAALLDRHGDVRGLVLGIGLPGVALYVWHYVRLARSGYRVPRPKVVLFVSTALCSIAAWGLGSFGEAFFIMNFFHAWQYLALVWWAERRGLASLLGGSLPLALAVLLGITMAYGFWRAWEPWHARFTIALGNVVSLMHFWYDGFIWSVQRKQVP